MASRIMLFQGSIEVARSTERPRAFLRSLTTEATSISVTLTFLQRGMLPAGARTWELDGHVEKTIEEIAHYISREDVSVTLSA